MIQIHGEFGSRKRTDACGKDQTAGSDRGRHRLRFRENKRKCRMVSEILMRYTVNYQLLFSSYNEGHDTNGCIVTKER